MSFDLNAFLCLVAHQVGLRIGEMVSSLIPKHALALLFSILFVGLAPKDTFAQQPGPVAANAPVTISTRLISPFAIKENDKYTGFSLDLWDALATKIGRAYTVVEKNTLKDLLESVEKKEVDLAIAAISITAEREEKFDFSQPMFDSGLQIMVRTDPSDNAYSLNSLKNLIFSGPMPSLWSILAFLILVPAHLVWWFERKHPKSIVSSNYFPGIFHAIWWATGAAHGQQLDFPRSRVGRVVSALSIFVSVIFIAFFTANVTTALTVQQLKSDINGPEDLPGKRVATIANSTSANYLRANNIIVVGVPTIEQAYEALRLKQVDAIVYDSPILLYYSANEGKGKFAVVGSIFKREAYGILFQQGSLLRKPVNEALLKLREDGTYDILYRKWFGKEEKS